MKFWPWTKKVQTLDPPTSFIPNGTTHPQSPTLPWPDHIFWTQVDVQGENDCWTWKGYRLPTGEAYVLKPFREFDEVRPRRMAYALARGPIPFVGPRRRAKIKTTCQNDDCCNPAHSFKAGTS